MSRHHRIVALVTGTALALALGGAVTAYNGTVVQSLTITGPGANANCGQLITFTVKALDGEDQPVEGASVAWSVSSTPPHADVVHTTPTVTNASGIATTTITFAAEPGSRTVTASVGKEISADSVVNIVCGAVAGATGTPGGGGGTGGLPATSTVADISATRFPIENLLALVALVLGIVMIVRRFAFIRR